MPSSSTLARAMPPIIVLNAPLSKPNVAGLVAVNVWRCKSSQLPPSYQSWPRVGTIISSVLISLTL